MVASMGSFLMVDNMAKRGTRFYFRFSPLILRNANSALEGCPGIVRREYHSRLADRSSPSNRFSFWADGA
jgi:hypothetical protein